MIPTDPTSGEFALMSVILINGIHIKVQSQVSLYVLIKFGTLVFTNRFWLYLQVHWDFSQQENWDSGTVWKRAKCVFREHSKCRAHNHVAQAENWWDSFIEQIMWCPTVYTQTFCFTTNVIFLSFQCSANPVSNTNPSSSKPDNLIHMRGLPYECTGEDIVKVLIDNMNFSLVCWLITVIFFVY